MLEKTASICHLCSTGMRNFPVPGACKTYGFHYRQEQELFWDFSWSCFGCVAFLLCQFDAPPPRKLCPPQQSMLCRFCQWKMDFHHGSQVLPWSPPLPVICHHLAFCYKKRIALPSPTCFSDINGWPGKGLRSWKRQREHPKCSEVGHGFLCSTYNRR